MDKNVIKKYAIWARRELIERVSQRAMIYGITAKDAGDPNAESVNGHLLSQAERRQRQALIRNIKTKSYEQVMEEVAYTWFNRFAALRFMEVNGYLPSHIRVFTNDAGEFKPQILAEAIHLELDGLDMNKVYELESANKSEELFKYLLIVQCNALNSILPGMFQRIEDYTELLLPDYLLREGSVIEQMVTNIPEEDWTDQVQIIGWLYQYYNTEPKDKVFENLKKNIKISKENIPAATQLFTPDWIVHYMVENSLGRLWVEGHPNEEMKKSWKYYLEEAEQEPEVQKQLAEIRKEYAKLNPEDIKVIDPCMGSGHILVVLFDVLLQIYESCGYSAREAVSLIVEKNLYGLDIDERAAQLAYFAVMMKARKHDRRFFIRGIQPRVYAIRESNNLDRTTIDYFVNRNFKLKAAMDTFTQELYDAKEYGSILNVSMVDFPALYARFEEIKQDNNILSQFVLTDLLPFVQIAEAMAQKYDVVVTNPPYMGGGGMSAKLSNYVKNNYPNSKSDLFAVFIERCGRMIDRNRYQAMITQHAWMFLSSYEMLRTSLQRACIINMAHLGAHAFDEIGGEIVQTTAFVLQNCSNEYYRGSYIKLVNMGSEEEKEKGFFSESHYCVSLDMFKFIPGNTFAYWASKPLLCAFNNDSVYKHSVSPSQNVTGNNNRFLRFHWEISKSLIGGRDLWIFYAKGGDYRKWWGNLDYVINWTPEARHIYQHGDGAHASQIINYEYWYREGITWGLTASTRPSFRIMPEGATFDKQGSTVIVEKDMLEYVLGMLNTKVYLEFAALLNSTISIQVKDVRLMPLIIQQKERVDRFVHESVQLSKCDWDSFETSWGFKKHPLVPLSYEKKEQERSQWGKHRMESFGKVQCHFENWQQETEGRFNQLKANEEELNRIFIDIYGLQDELTPEVEDKDVTVRKADLGREIRSLISYAVGCMFGRYCLDKPGLVYAGGDFETQYRKDSLADESGNRITFGGIGISVSNSYTQYLTPWNEWRELTFSPDADNIIPICDDEYFEDDIVARFIKFIEVAYGKDSLEENLKFIADALGGKGTPRQVIRSYFLNDFYADHLKIYQKRPIYWLFDSGKKNGFKCLIYMHRYQPDTIARIRTDYVHEQQSRYRTAIADLEQRINGASTSERVKLSKQLATLQGQAEEIRVYEEKIHHLADQMIKIDLDDGVKHNYEIFKDVLAKIK